MTVREPLFPSAVPVVSAMMPAYNAAATIGEAVAAVRAQTFADWELVVVDDGSTDGTADAVAAAAAGDPRVRCHRLARNVGRGAARNAALALCRGEFVAITDADDVSLPERFARQVAYLRAHPRVGVLGAQLLYFSEAGDTPAVMNWPCDDAEIRAEFARGVMAVAHAAAMMRRDLVAVGSGYRPDLNEAEDFDLFLQLLKQSSFATLPDVAVRYRRRPLREELSYRRWVQTHLHHEYVLYCDRVRRGERTTAEFTEWRRRPGAQLRVLTWHTLRYGRAAVRAVWQHGTAFAPSLAATIPGIR